MKIISFLRRIILTANNRKFFKKMLLTYLLCSSIVFLGFSFLINSLILNNYMASINKLNNKALFQSANTSSITLENLYNYFYMDSLEDVELIKLLHADKYDAVLSLSSSYIKEKLLNYSNLVSSFYIINYKGDFICSNLDTYKNIENFFDQDVINLLSARDYSSDIFINMPREIQYNIYGINYNKKYISLIFRKFNKGFLVINLNYEKFSEMINYNSYNEDSQTLVVNKDGYVMADSNGKLFGKQILNYPLYKELLNQPKTSGSYTTRQDGSKLMVNYRKNELFGIVYLTITQYHIMDKNNTLLLKSVLYSISAIFISVSLTFYGSWVLYKPINKLRKTVGYKDNNNIKIDEFHYITNSYETIKKNFHTMQKDRNEYHKTTRKQILKEILNTGSVKNLASNVKLLYEELNKNSFITVNIYFDNYESIASDDSENLALLKYAIENIFRELLPSHYILETVDCNTHLSGIINFNNTFALATHTSENTNPVYDPSVNNQHPEDLENILTNLQTVFYQYFSIYISCSIGSPVNNLLDIAESYQHAGTAYFYQLNKNNCAILNYRNLIFKNTELQQYPYKQEKNILEAVKNGESDRLSSSIEEFFLSIYPYSYNQVILYLLTLHSSLERMEQKCNISYNEETIKISLQSMQNERLYKIKELFAERCQHSMSLYQEVRSNNSMKNEIIEQIMTVVNNNIANPNLSVDIIAEEVHLSNSYLRNIFKEYTGNTLSNYIIEKRLEQICALLRDTDLSIQKIADQLGFSSKNYFFTFFKNYMGMTPKQYRIQTSCKSS